jgi:hypothetical protein
MLIPTRDFNFLKAVIFSITCVVLFFGFWSGSASLLQISLGLGIGLLWITPNLPRY